MTLLLLSDRRLPKRLLSNRRFPDLHRDIHISQSFHRDISSDLAINALVGVRSVGISVDIYAMVGEAVNSRGNCTSQCYAMSIWGLDGRTNNGWERDVVPIK